MACGWNTHGLKNVDERTFAEADLRPRDDANNKRKPGNIEEHQHNKSPAQRLRDCRLWIRRFASGASHNLNSEKTEKPQDYSESHTFPSIRQKTAMRRVVCKADLRKTHAAQQRRTQNQNRYDGHYLDHRKPILKSAEVPDAGAIDVEDHRRKQSDPNPRRGGGKPELAVNRSSHHFAAHHHHHAQPIRQPNRKT